MLRIHWRRASENFRRSAEARAYRKGQGSGGFEIGDRDAHVYEDFVAGTRRQQMLARRARGVAWRRPSCGVAATGYAVYDPYSSALYTFSSAGSSLDARSRLPPAMQCHILVLTML